MYCFASWDFYCSCVEPLLLVVLLVVVVVVVGGRCVCCGRISSYTMVVVDGAYVRSRCRIIVVGSCFFSIAL